MERELKSTDEKIVNKNSDTTSLSNMEYDSRHLVTNSGHECRRQSGDVKSNLVVYNPQFRYSTPKKLASKPTRETITPRKIPRMIEKAKNIITGSVRKMLLDFESEPTQPTQASVAEVSTGGCQGIVNLDDNSLGTESWKLFADKVNNVEEAANATKEPIFHLENLDTDDCHPEDHPWSQPLICRA